MHSKLRLTAASTLFAVAVPAACGGGGAGAAPAPASVVFTRTVGGNGDLYPTNSLEN